MGIMRIEAEIKNDLSHYRTVWIRKGITPPNQTSPRYMSSIKKRHRSGREQNGLAGSIKIK